MEKSVSWPPFVPPGKTLSKNAIAEGHVGSDKVGLPNRCTATNSKKHTRCLSAIEFYSHGEVRLISTVSPRYLPSVPISKIESPTEEIVVKLDLPQQVMTVSSQPFG